MLTQCPGCQTVFRVTSTILRAAHGQVRCGRCGTQFDAIEHLMDGEDPQTPDDSAARTADHDKPPSPGGHEYAAATPAHEEIVLEGNRIEISGIYRHLDEDDGTDTPAHSRTVIEEFNIEPEEWLPPDHQAGPADDEFETELEDVEQELITVSLTDAIASLDTSALRHANDSTDRITIATIGHLANRSAATGQTADAAGTATDSDLSQAKPVVASTTMPSAARTPASPFAPLQLADEPFAKPPDQRRWPWVMISVALGLLLFGQALHHSRDALARHPSFGPQLGRLYAAIGQPLAPQWQLQAYSIKQWGIVSDPQAPGTLRVRASVTNGAGFAQPYPLLQLSLEDRFGGKVGTRDFKPEEYLASSAQATRLLAAGEAANVDLAIVDPGQDAVGFQFDTCLQLRGGLQCTHDLALQRR